MCAGADRSACMSQYTFQFLTHTHTHIDRTPYRSSRRCLWSTEILFHVEDVLRTFISDTHTQQSLQVQHCVSVLRNVAAQPDIPQGGCWSCSVLAQTGVTSSYTPLNPTYSESVSYAAHWIPSQPLILHTLRLLYLIHTVSKIWIFPLIWAGIWLYKRKWASATLPCFEFSFFHASLQP